MSKKMQRISINKLKYFLKNDPLLISFFKDEDHFFWCTQILSEET